jgi:hypothetical protein
MAARAGDLLPVEYFHVVFTVPAEIARIAYWNKEAIYGLLFKASAEAVITIAADPKRLGARVGMTSVLHTWGSALTHHPHVHMIVPGGGLSSACPGQRSGGTRWVGCRPGFFLPVKVLSRLFRRLFLDGLMTLHRAGKLAFFGEQEELAGADAFAAWLTPLRKIEWVVYAKPPFGGPEAVLAYLSRYTHRVAISNSRLVSADAETVAFRWKDYRIKNRDRQKIMRLATGEFIRRFLIHVLPDGFHRIRHGACPGPDPGGFSPVPAAGATSRRSADCSAPNRQWMPTRSTPTRPCRSPSESPARTAAGRCGSSRSSSAASARRPAHRRERTPHDDSAITFVEADPDRASGPQAHQPAPYNHAITGTASTAPRAAAGVPPITPRQGAEPASSRRQILRLTADGTDVRTLSP